MSSEQETFTKELREAVNKCGLTNKALSELAGLDPMTVWRFANGERGLSPESLDAIARVLDLHVKKGPGYKRAGARRNPKAK